jgi:hypothetical protein
MTFVTNENIVVTNETRRMEAIGGAGLSTHAKAALKRMVRHKRCVAVLVETWITATENRLAGTLKGAAQLLRWRIDESSPTSAVIMHNQNN